MHCSNHYNFSPQGYKLNNAYQCTRSDDPSHSYLYIQLKPSKLKMGHVPLTAPLSGMVSHPLSETININYAVLKIIKNFDDPENTDLERELKILMQLIIEEAIVTRAMQHKVRLISFTVPSEQRSAKVGLG